MPDARKFQRPDGNTIVLAIAQALITAAISVERTRRRAALIVGPATCALGGRILAWAVLQSNFWIFRVGTASVGAFQAFAGFYRLAAAPAVPVDHKTNAISFILARGVLAAFFGSVLASWTKDMLPAIFAGSYLLIASLGVTSMALFVIAFKDHRTHALPVKQHDLDRQRPLKGIFTVPISWAAVAKNVVGGVVMMLLMIAAPIGAVMSGHSIDDGAGMIQWHLVGIYAPSLFAGALVSRFGVARILSAGMVLTAACSRPIVTRLAFR